MIKFAGEKQTNNYSIYRMDRMFCDTAGVACTVCFTRSCYREQDSAVMERDLYRDRHQDGRRGA
jgi:hypothetical protein